MYREGRAVSVSVRVAAEDCWGGGDKEGSRPDDEDSFRSGTRFERIAINAWCCRLLCAHNHKSASKPNAHPLSTRFCRQHGQMTPLPRLHSLKINVKIEHL
jgi:hypothetical protein